MDTDMDIDMDIDLDVDPEIAQLEAEAMRIDAETSAFQQQSNSNNTATDTTQSAANSVPEKVNIQGLDNLTTADVKYFASEYFPLDQFVRIEWINDTSANVTYETPDAAAAALDAFTDTEALGQSYIPPLQERNAKKLSTHPNAELKIRQATTKDVKAPRAHEASRFYLLNPDQDPRERKRLTRGRGGRPRDDRGDYRRRRFDDQEHRRRRDEDDNVAFDVSMYDDDAGSSIPNGSRNGSRLGRRGSQSSITSSSESGRQKRVRFRARKDDLFANRKSDGRLRDRSASPDPDGDGRMGFEEDENSIRRRIRQRSLTPPSIRRERKSSAQDNSARELFPAQRTPSALLSPPASNEIELFPKKPSPAKRPKELFPHKTSISNHRRTDAFDAAAETADLFATGMAAPFKNGPGEPRSRDLADRISKKSSSYGRLNAWPDSPAIDEQAVEPDEITVRGSAQAEQVPGFSIRGAAQTAESTAKELFPLKAGANFGKELFAEKIKGRGGPRRKAEDMFF
ncbi:hypothetical protein AOQ84DRAFT_365130 [Glonium stellatum]|uniref:Uncharacterized protein n=1 Tax=Glonium stellatum TaxID=574774 RepID=A0A8E2JS72_9PEZI|nr:hypothetical protein AOQ84DRAFT_365130 [Glonium stellatum]